jgi:HEAT repeat protein
VIIVEALGKIGDPEATDTLRLALGDVDSAVSAAARKSLKQVGALPDKK